jgi:hypothetical protein
MMDDVTEAGGIIMRHIRPERFGLFRIPTPANLVDVASDL